MKLPSQILKLVVAAGLITLAAGCATTSIDKENALSASGFKVITPKTAAQERKLKALPTDHVSMIKKAGKIYYVYPDVPRNVVYVGGPKQYQAYQQYRLEQRAADENLETARIAEDQSTQWEMWNGWGAWTPAGWYY